MVTKMSAKRRQLKNSFIKDNFEAIETNSLKLKPLNRFKYTSCGR